MADITERRVDECIDRAKDMGYLIEEYHQGNSISVKPSKHSLPVFEIHKFKDGNVTLIIYPNTFTQVTKREVLELISYAGKDNIHVEGNWVSFNLKTVDATVWHGICNYHLANWLATVQIDDPGERIALITSKLLDAGFYVDQIEFEDDLRTAVSRTEDMNEVVAELDFSDTCHEVITYYSSEMRGDTILRILTEFKKSATIDDSNSVSVVLPNTSKDILYNFLVAFLCENKKD